MNRMSILVIGFMVGCDHLNAADAIDYRPFFDAVQAGNVDELKRFCEENRDMNIEKRDCFGNTPLHVASVCGGVEVAKVLLAWGANVEAKDDDGYTPLLNASFFGKADVISLLLNYGANKEAKNNDGKTAAEVARNEGYKNLADFIESYQELPEIKEPDEKYN